MNTFSRALCGAGVVLAMALGAPSAQAAPGTVDLITAAKVRLDIGGAGRIGPAGDVNGDGRADLIVYSGTAGHNNRPDSGSYYVVYGAAALTDVDLTNLGSRGFRVDGPGGPSQIQNPSPVGDVNGDGHADIVVPYGFAEKFFVVLGSASPSNLDLAALGDRGYVIQRAGSDNLNTKFSVAPAGDVNGDGLADVAIGMGGAHPPGKNWAGSTFIVFGSADKNTLTLDSLGGRGVRINGAKAGDGLGQSITALGDVNGDGRGDLLVSADTADTAGRGPVGSAYVIYGSTSTASLDLSTLGARGDVIDGVDPGGYTGYATGSIGDFNGDGRGDFVVAAPFADNNSRDNSGSVYVIYGRAAPGRTDLASLGTGGFRVDGATARTLLGGVGHFRAGDFNGDGLADLVLGAVSATPPGRVASGTTWVIYGRRTAPPTIDLATFDDQLVKIVGLSGDQIGNETFGPGDINGDGRDDIVVSRRHPSDGGYVVLGSIARYAPATGTAGTAMSAAPTVTKSGDATFSISPALPSGLSLNAATGQVTGTPLRAHTRSHTVTMQDDQGRQTASLPLDVAAAPDPDTAITHAPPALSTETRPSFSFTATASVPTTTQCRVDGGAWTPCSSPRQLPSMADGRHTFQVRGVHDDAVDRTPASHTFEVDTAAPSVTLVGPDGVTADPSPLLEYSSPASDVARFECRLDGAPWTTCAADAKRLNDLADGNHTFEVRAIDHVANVGPIRQTSFRVVRVPSLLSAPVITGTAVVGSTLTATTGVWQGTPGIVEIQWLRCDAGNHCHVIPGAVGARYAVSAQDVAFTLLTRVTALNAGGSGDARTASTSRVLAPAIPETPTPTPTATPTAPPVPPAADPTTPAPPSPAQTATEKTIAERAPAMLQVDRAALSRGELAVDARIGGGAEGVIEASFRAKGTTIRWQVPIPASGLIKVVRELDGAHRGATSGILELRYAGSRDVRDASVRLRAGGKAASLTRPSVLRKGDKLMVSGKVSRRAKAKVRLRLDYVSTSGELKSTTFSAKVVNGRWRTTMSLPNDRGERAAVISAQFTGDHAAKLQGALTVVEYAL